MLFFAVKKVFLLCIRSHNKQTNLKALYKSDIIIIINDSGYWRLIVQRSQLIGICLRLPLSAPAIAIYYYWVQKLLSFGWL